MFNPHKEEFFYLEYLNHIQTRTKWTYAKYGNYEVLKFYRDDNEGYGCVYDSIRRLNRGPLNDSVIFVTQGPNHNFRAKTMTAQMKTKCMQTLASYETHTQPDVSDIPAYANDEVKLPNPKWVLYTEQQYPIYNMCKRPKTYGIINAERPKYFVVGKDDVVISATNEKYLYNKVQLSNLYDLASGKG